MILHRGFKWRPALLQSALWPASWSYSAEANVRAAAELVLFLGRARTF